MYEVVGSIVGFLKTYGIGSASLGLIYWNLRRGKLWRKEDLKKESLREEKNERKENIKKIEACLKDINLIPIILEGMYLKRENNILLIEKLNSIKYSVEELGHILINNCKVDCFSEHIEILKDFLTQLENVEELPKKIDEIFDKLMEYSLKDYKKINIDLNLEKFDEIKNNLSFVVYESFRILPGIVHKSIAGPEIKNLKSEYFECYISNLLKLLTKFKEAYFNEDAKEIERLITESYESTYFFIKKLDYYNYAHAKSKSELGYIVDAKRFHPEFQFMSDEDILFYDYLQKSKTDSIKVEYESLTVN